ncbi:MAG: hypothetical protein QOD76_69 [Solirubrobacteraceae bacterium]|jgi:hypothetical protein|nr:hypothetical protein [Solirubrobacteraceae bacterium]
MATNDDRVDQSRRTRRASPPIPRRSRRLRLVLEYLRSHDRLARAASEAEGRRSSDLGDSKGNPT